MCGIFGTVGASEFQNRMLAVLNEERGRESAGFYADGMVYKITGAVTDAIINGDVPRRVMDSIVFLGHTRQSTHGAVTKRNCHPFRAGNIIGAHNGIINNFHELKFEYKTLYPEVADMEVDSEIIFWLLNKFGHDGLKQLEGYMGLWWIDQRAMNELYLYNFDCELAWGNYENALLFSSQREHLKLAGVKDIRDTSAKGQLLTFDLTRKQIKERKKVRAVRSAYNTHWSLYDMSKSNTASTVVQEGEKERLMLHDLYYCQTCDAHLQTYLTFRMTDHETQEERICCGQCSQEVVPVEGMLLDFVGEE